MAGVEALKFANCTPIQEQAIPVILAGKDVAGLAQTGTGKTAAFVLPLLDRLIRSKENQSDIPVETKENDPRPIFTQWKKNNFILVLVPTRELAEQVCDNVRKLGDSSGASSVAIYGGVGYEQQKKSLKAGVDFIVATPGRLIDLYKEHDVDLGQARAVVFDEADRMFDMGFKDDMKYILRRVPKDRQFLVFSATLNFDVLNTAYEFGAQPVEVNISRDQAKAEHVRDELFHVGFDEKPKFLLSVLQKHKPRQAIIFSNFKHNVDRIAKFLTLNGVPAMGISSLISQNQRTRIMELFRAENDRNILVATDVAARGLDIKGVDLVLNFELPDDAENYVHRIGRTGRAGAEGKAFSFVGDRDVEALQRIESYLGHKITIGWLEENEIIKEFKPYPRESDRDRKSFSVRPGGGQKSHSDQGPRQGFQGKGEHRGGGPREHRADHRGGQNYRDRQGSRPQEKPRDGKFSREARGPRDQQKPNEQRPQQNFQSRNERGPNRNDRFNGANNPRRPHPSRGPSGGSRPAYTHKPGSGAAPSANVLAKVAGFFKKLFS